MMRPTIHVVMAVHRPDLPFLEKQIASLTRQSDVDAKLWIAVDGPQEQAAHDYLGALAAVEGVIFFPEHRGTRMCFLESLAIAVKESGGEGDLFAFCDQDDIWKPQKLARQAQVLRKTKAPLVHCDARVVNDAGHVVHPSLHRMEQRSRDMSLVSLIMINAVSGMTALFDKRTAQNVIRAAASTDVLHDHLSAVTAAACGKIVYIDEPLVDYRQHERNVIGASDRKQHRFNHRILLDLKAYVGRCRAQFLDRAHMFQQLSTLDFQRASPAWAQCRLLFGRGWYGADMFLLAMKALARGEIRFMRMSMRCWIGKVTLLFEALRERRIQDYDGFIAEKWEQRAR